MVAARGYDKQINRKKHTPIPSPISYEENIAPSTSLKYAHLESEKLNRNRYSGSIKAEKRRLARHIHDELGNDLTILLNELSMLQKQLPKRQQKLHDKIALILKTVNDMVSKTHNIIDELRPSTIDIDDLQKAMSCYLEEFYKRTGIQFKSNLNSITYTFEKDLSFVIFNIFKELMTNILRHADASEITITLNKNKDNLIMIVHDNGIGITENNILDPKSYGIIGIKESIDSVGGKFNIKGIPNEGTIVTIHIPIK